MDFNISCITDPQFVSENRLPAHSSHSYYRSRQEAELGRSSYVSSLNGVWKMHYAKTPEETVPGFHLPEFDSRGWDDIAVPAHIQLHGYDRPQYANTQYPWDGLETL